MLKQFPIRLSLKILIAVALMLAAAKVLVYPFYVRVQEKIPALWSYYSGNDKKATGIFETDKAALAGLEQQAGVPANETGKTGKSAACYDFIQEVLKKHGIMSVKINSGNQITVKNIKREDFSLHFSSTYHTVGLIVSDLENGPFFCSVKPLHVFSKSLLNYTLDVDMSLSFYRFIK
jgi:hypothetical protein